jgi:hypothetical protein
MIGSFLKSWVLYLLCCLPFAGSCQVNPAPENQGTDLNFRLKKRWLFVWRNLSDPREVDSMLARFPRAAAAGYNGVVFAPNIPAAKAGDIKRAAETNHLDLIAIVMHGVKDRNYVEGVLASNVLFTVHNGKVTHLQETPTPVLNGNFEEAIGNRFKSWSLQDDDGIVSFADDHTFHAGKTSLRMENIDKNQHQHCRVSQPIKLQPFRQYLIHVWVKTENLTPADAEVKVLTADGGRQISFQTFEVARTQDWKLCELVFNSLGTSDARLYLGSWSGRSGTLWWDDVSLQEIALVNVLRRPGCPLTVRDENGKMYDESRDYEPIADPVLNPWHAYHDEPTIKLRPGSRITEGARLRVSYYHPLIVYQDRVTVCLSEPKIFDEWREDVKRANDLLHPTGFLMSHDELRVANQCALCQSKHLTAGQLLAWNVKNAAKLIREVRPDAEIWVWSDMFDPMHNAVDNYYAVNGTLKGSWEGLDKDIGIVNWHGGLQGKNCKFFSDRGLKQILSGYYDHDEDGHQISSWLVNTATIPGITGAMYTTWENRYDAMDKWAAKAWGAK